MALDEVFANVPKQWTEANGSVALVILIHDVCAIGA